MLEKAKEVVKWVLGPVIVVAGFIFYLFTKINSLKSQVARDKADKPIQKTLDKLEETKNDADQKEHQFDSDYNDYKSSMAKYVKSTGKLPD